LLAACLLVFCVFLSPAKAKEINTISHELRHPEHKMAPVEQLCNEVGHKLRSVSELSCVSAGMTVSRRTSVSGRVIGMKEYPPLADKTPQARILLIGGIHGDELSSVSIVFHWMHILNQYHSGLFHWHVLPLLNPDGLLQQPSTRVNAHGVDLNRNFNTPDWLHASQQYWQKNTHQDPRRYPGAAPLSEPESLLLAEEIADFKPHAIVSVHAPFGVLDFDGPPAGPSSLGQLHVQLLGTYPGSLGKFAGEQLKIPVITIELPHAGIMPDQLEQSRIWMDLIRWLKIHIPKQETLLTMQQRDINSDNR